jgi:hypothetical protein
MSRHTKAKSSRAWLWCRGLGLVVALNMVRRSSVTSRAARLRRDRKRVLLHCMSLQLARNGGSSRTEQCLELVEVRTRFARREPFAF